MKAIIEHGGLDLSLYDVIREHKETNHLFEGRLTAAKTQIFFDLIFVNTMLETIYLAIDEDDLRETMRKAFDKRGIQNKNINKVRFYYYFGTFITDSDADDMDYMEVIQADNANRLIYVEL